MTDETQTNLSDETVIDDEVLDDGVLDDETDSGDDDVGDSQVEETEEVEHEGKKYKIHKELKQALMFQADYTRKTQAVAEERRAVEAMRNQYAQASQEHLQGLAQLVAIDEQINQYASVDWNTLNSQDPFQASQLWNQYQQLKEGRQMTAAQLQQREQQRTFEAQQISAKQLEEARQVLERDIKGWSPEMAQQISSHAAKEYGFQPHELSGVMDPRHVKVLHDAWVGRQLMAKQSEKPKPEVTAKPVKTVGGNSAKTSKDPAQMTDAEFVAWRRRQIAQRNKG